VLLVNLPAALNFANVFLHLWFEAWTRGAQGTIGGARIPTERGTFGGAAVHIINLIRQKAEAMRHLTTSLLQQLVVIERVITARQ